MEFKCKKCNSTKYRQISISVKQCEKCGALIQSEGVVDPKVLDVTEEPDTTVKENKKLNPGAKFRPCRIRQRMCENGMIEYYIDPDDWFK